AADDRRLGGLSGWRGADAERARNRRLGRQLSGRDLEDVYGTGDGEAPGGRLPRAVEVAHLEAVPPRSVRAELRPVRRHDDDDDGPDQDEGGRAHTGARALTRA